MIYAELAFRRLISQTTAQWILIGVHPYTCQLHQLGQEHQKLAHYPWITLVLANVFSKALYNNTDVELLTFQHQTFRAVLSSKSTEQITIQMRN